MQNLIYDEAPYDILFYDANLDVYRNDRFAGWQNMPAERDAVVHLRHPQLHPAHRRDGRAAADARRRRRRRPPPALGQPRRRPHRGAQRRGPADGSTAPSGRASNTTLLLGLVAVVAVVVVVGGLVCSRRRVRRQRRGRVARPADDAIVARGSPPARPPPDPGERPVSGRYIARKLARALVTIVAIVLLNFVLFRMMPGSPERADQEPEPHPRGHRREPRARWGLDKPHPPGPAGRVHRVDRSRATSATRSSTAASR